MRLVVAVTDSRFTVTKWRLRVVKGLAEVRREARSGDSSGPPPVRTMEKEPALRAVVRSYHVWRIAVGLGRHLHFLFTWILVSSPW